MSKWIFLEDFDLKPVSHQAINLAFAISVTLHIEDSEIVIFTAGVGHTEPHVMTFTSKESCQNAYNNLKSELRAEK